MRTNYFYGYSFSDMYDINTTIYELYLHSDTNYTKDNWVCNHNGWDNELAGKVYNFFVKKENVHIFEDDTTEALKSLCEKYSVAIPHQVGKNNEDLKNESWKDLFLDKIEITEEFKILSTIHFLNRMCIAVDKVDIEILNKYEQIEFENIKKEILEYHLAANSKYWYKRYGNSRLKTDYHKSELHKRQSKSKLEENLQENYSKKNLENIIQNIEKKKFIGYEDFNELNKRMTEFQIQLIKNEKNIDIQEIEYLTEKFSKYPVGKYISIILFASIYRYKMIISGVTGINNPKNFQRANEIYYDIGNIDGIVSSALYYIISHNYFKDTDDWKIIFQTQEWERLKNLCRVTGSYRYKQLMDNLEAKKSKSMLD